MDERVEILDGPRENTYVRRTTRVERSWVVTMPMDQAVAEGREPLAYWTSMAYGPHPEQEMYAVPALPDEEGAWELKAFVADDVLVEGKPPDDIAASD